MISKAIEVSISNTYPKKLWLLLNEQEWECAGGIIWTGGTTVIYLLFNIINTSTCIGISNLKDNIQKSILSKFRNNIKDILDNMSSNYTIIINKGGRHD